MSLGKNNHAPHRALDTYSYMLVTSLADAEHAQLCTRKLFQNLRTVFLFKYFI